MIDLSLVKFFLFVVYIVHFSSSQEIKITKCVNTPNTWKKVEKSVKECQEDVKLKIIEDAFQSLNGGWDDSFFDHDDQYSWDLNPHEQHPPTDHHHDHHSSIHDHHTLSHDHHPSIHDPHTSNFNHHTSINDHHTLIHDHHTPIYDQHTSSHDHHIPIENHHTTNHDHNSPIHDHHSPIHDHNSPIHDHHSPIYDHNSPIHDHHSPIHDHHSPIHDHHSPIHDHHSSIHDHHSPIHDHHSTIHDHHPEKSPQFHRKNAHSSSHHSERHSPLRQDHPHVAHQIESPHISMPKPFTPSTHQDTKTKTHPQMQHVESTDTDSLTNPVEHHHIDFNDFRKKRDANDHGWIHPSTITYHDKRIAGCIMQCIYEKNHAVDQLGWPTLDGLVNFYSEGVSEHGYFMATLRAVDYCLKGSSAKYHVNRRSTPEKGQTCDVAFDVFDCISDRITEYCSDHHHHV